MIGSYDGKYFYLVKNFATDELVRQSSRCLIIGETKKSYRIRLLEYTNGHFPDECLWVRKRSVCRSYFNNETKTCEIYNLTPADQSCRACLQRCQRRYDLLRNREPQG